MTNTTPETRDLATQAAELRNFAKLDNDSLLEALTEASKGGWLRFRDEPATRDRDALATRIREVLAFELEIVEAELEPKRVRLTTEEIKALVPDGKTRFFAEVGFKLPTGRPAKADQPLVKFVCCKCGENTRVAHVQDLFQLQDRCTSCVAADRRQSRKAARARRKAAKAE